MGNYVNKWLKYFIYGGKKNPGITLVEETNSCKTEQNTEYFLKDVCHVYLTTIRKTLLIMLNQIIITIYRTVYILCHFSN